MNLMTEATLFTDGESENAAAKQEEFSLWKYQMDCRFVYCMQKHPSLGNVYWSEGPGVQCHLLGDPSSVDVTDFDRELCNSVKNECFVRSRYVAFSERRLRI